jgi:hypothetical protein
MRRPCSPARFRDSRRTMRAARLLLAATTGGLLVRAQQAPFSTTDGPILSTTVKAAIGDMLARSGGPAYSVALVRLDARAPVELAAWGNATEDGDPMTPDVRAPLARLQTRPAERAADPGEHRVHVKGIHGRGHRAAHRRLCARAKRDGAARGCGGAVVEDEGQGRAARAAAVRPVRVGACHDPGHAGASHRRVGVCEAWTDTLLCADARRGRHPLTYTNETSRAELIARMPLLRPTFELREQWHYSNLVSPRHPSVLSDADGPSRT